MLRATYRGAKRAVVFVVGGVLLLCGGVLGLVPGIPGFPLVFLGLVVLASEFPWARTWLARLRARSRRVWVRLRRLGRACGRRVRGRPDPSPPKRDP